ncbi:alpha-hydroxy-acid oxidizing protein [Streptomyces sp. MBT62]|uniref:alpha-hydroxy-acid oxidizing protein n=1 Tax=Streptomyces sp. MBT62 TaxID=2800410 RepID=UPI0035AC06A0
MTDAGCTALVVTVDSPVLGAGERNRRNGFHDLPPGLRCENLVDLRDGERGHVRQIAMSPELYWEHLDWLRRTTSLPILLKGVLHPEDARLAVRHGAVLSWMDRRDTRFREAEEAREGEEEAAATPS